MGIVPAELWKKDNVQFTASGGDAVQVSPAVCSVQCAVCSVQCAVCSVQCEIHKSKGSENLHSRRDAAGRKWQCPEKPLCEH